MRRTTIYVSLFDRHAAILEGGLVNPVHRKADRTQTFHSEPDRASSALKVEQRYWEAGSRSAANNPGGIAQIPT